MNFSNDTTTFSLIIPDLGNKSSEYASFSQDAMLHAIKIIEKVEKYLGTPILLFGIIINILTLLTLQQPKLKESPYIFLWGLAMANLWALTFIIIELHHDTRKIYWHQYRVYIYYPMTNIADTVGIWTMVIMTLERCIFVQFPLWGPILNTKSSAKLKLVIIFVTSIVINFPRFFWFHVTPCHNGTDNSTSKSEPRFTAKSYSTTFTDTVTWIHSILLFFLPILILLVSNSFLVYKVQTQRKRQSKLGIHNKIETVWSREQTRLTITLIAIVAVFSMHVLPSAFSHINIAEHLFGKRIMVIIIYQHIANFLIWLNLSHNFLFYTFINIRFKKAFKRMLHGWQKTLHIDKLCDQQQHDKPGAKYPVTNLAIPN